MSKINRSVLNMISGGAGYLIPMVLNLVFTPVILSNLGSEAYGLQSLVNVIIGYLTVADMGLDIPVTKFIAEYKAKEDKVAMNKLLNSTLQIYLVIGFLGMLIIFGFSRLLVDSVFKIPALLHSEALTVFFLAGFGFFGGITSMWGKSIFNGLQRYEIANGISIISNLLSTVIGIILVVNGNGVVGYVFVRVLFSLISGLVYFYLSKKYLPDFKITLGINVAVWLLLKTQIGYGFLLRISGILSSRMDQTLIGAWVGIAAVGVYAIPFLITSSIISLIASITHFIFPMASTLHATNKTEELKSIFLKTSRFVASMASVLFVPLLLFGDKFLMLWVGEAIGDQGSRVLLLLGIATYSCTLSNIVINVFTMGIGQLRIFTIYAISRSIMMAVGCAIFIKPFGIEGAGLAMLITCIADYIFFVYVVRKFLRLTVFEVLTKAYVKPVFLAAFLAIACYFLRFIANSWLGLVSVCGIYITLYIGIGFLITVFGETEKRALMSIWNMVTLKVKK